MIALKVTLFFLLTALHIKTSTSKPKHYLIETVSKPGPKFFEKDNL